MLWIIAHKTASTIVFNFSHAESLLLAHTGGLPFSYQYSMPL